MTAQELKIGDTFRRQGYKFTVANLRNECYKNGNPCIVVECTMNESKIIDSYFLFNPTTKVK